MYTYKKQSAPNPCKLFPAQQVCLFLSLSYPLDSFLFSKVRLCNAIPHCEVPFFTSPNPHSPVLRPPYVTLISLGKSFHTLFHWPSSCLPVYSPFHHELIFFLIGQLRLCWCSALEVGLEGDEPGPGKEERKRNNVFSFLKGNNPSK